MALDDVKDEQFGLILCSFCAVYIFKQSFAIPGSVLTVYTFLSLCSGVVCKHFYWLVSEQCILYTRGILIVAVYVATVCT